MSKFIRAALLHSVAMRATKVALVITPILTVFNHFGEIMELELGLVFWLQVGLTFLVPYCVSTYSSAMAIICTPEEDTSSADPTPAAVTPGGNR